LPLSRREAFGYPQAPLAWETKSTLHPERALSYLELWRVLLRGSYPEVVADPVRDATLWHASYTQTYLERDVRLVRQVGDLTQFQNFLRALATRCGQLLNLSDLARDLGLAVNTTKTWLSVLEASLQVIILRPYFANVGKRLVKTPKVYFADTGTLCYLTGLRDPEHAAASPMGGAVFENTVLVEIAKVLMNRGEDPHIYFWRTSVGSEVDIVVEVNDRLVPIEVKLSATPRPSMADSIDAFRRDVGRKAARGYVVHPGDLRLPLSPDVLALPFAEL
jgi:predicted AAA+ superfamily ATPase